MLLHSFLVALFSTSFFVNTNYTLSQGTHKRSEKHDEHKKSICINSRQNFSHFLALDEVVGGRRWGDEFLGVASLSREGSLSFRIDIAGCCPLVVVFYS